MKKKFIATLITSIGIGVIVTGCSNLEVAEKKLEQIQMSGQEDKTILDVAVFEGGYGRAYWDAIEKEFEAMYPNVDVVIDANPEIGEIIRPRILAGNAPDFIYLPTSNISGIGQALVKDKLLVDLTDVFLDPEIKDRILTGFLDNKAMKPYGDDKIYLAPLYYCSTGLFYNTETFEKNNWQVPLTWEEFFELGDKAKEVGKSLMTYQGLFPGYMEAMLIPALASAVGGDGFLNALSYEDGAWEQPEIIEAMKKIENIATGEYLMEGTVALDHTQSQSHWLLGNALFIPSGAWLEGEMKEAPREENFKWGFAAPPILEADDDKYVVAVVEEMYIPVVADEVELAKEFLKFQYSPIAIKLNAELAKGIPPIKGALEILKPFVEEATYETYKLFENGYIPYIYRFAAVEGTELLPREELFNSLTSVMNGELTAEEWAKHMECVSDAVRPNIVK